ncbi:MAG: hypothetical protein ACUZ8E_11995 [Candidatus Anammoxibacter sp.]
MKIDIKKLLSKIDKLEEQVARGDKTVTVVLGHVDGVDYQIRATRESSEFGPRLLHEDALEE